MAYSYQWIATDGTNETEINGATSSSYTLTNADEGNTIKVRVRFTDDAGNGESLASAATAAVTLRPNSPATGSPTITGTAQVGETLTADTTGISDDDGMESVAFSHQWITSDGSTDTDIEGATNATYTLSETDEGKAIKVTVSFTDDAGNAETLTSTATNAVAAAPTALTAKFLDTPSSYDGQMAFTFELRFSEEFDLSYVTLRDHAFTVTGGEVTGVRRLEGPGNIRWEITVRPDGEGEVTVALPATEDCADQGAICTGEGRKLSNLTELTVSVATPDNSAATGATTISGTAEVGQTLTASTSGIADSDGLDNATFTFQWLRVDGTNETEITQATTSGYTLTNADEGNTIKVRVSFTDDAGNEESLTSAATSAVSAAPIASTALTAKFLDTPSSHDGQTAFTFELRFSEEFPISYTTLRDHAFTVTGGSVNGARRLEPPGNVRWEITVTPDSGADVAVTLPVTEDCEADGAICTEDDRMLSTRLELTVSGPS